MHFEQKLVLCHCLQADVKTQLFTLIPMSLIIRERTEHSQWSIEN